MKKIVMCAFVMMGSCASGRVVEMDIDLLRTEVAFDEPFLTTYLFGRIEVPTQESQQPVHLLALACEGFEATPPTCHLLTPDENCNKFSRIAHARGASIIKWFNVSEKILERIRMITIEPEPSCALPANEEAAAQSARLDCRKVLWNFLRSLCPASGRK